MIIPGFLIGWATFPGIIIHEFAHKVACERRGVQVYEVVYFSLRGGGQVIHTQPRRYSDAFIISLAPFAVNTALALVFYSIAALSIEFHSGLLSIVPLWLGLSTGWHAIPSRGDTSNVWKGAKANWRSSVLAFFSLPLAVFLYIANLLKFVWFDAIYSLSLAVIVLIASDVLKTSIIAL